VRLNIGLVRSSIGGCGGRGLCHCDILRPSSGTTMVVDDWRLLKSCKVAIKSGTSNKSSEIRTKSSADSIGLPLDDDEADPDCIDASNDQFVR